MSDRVLLQQAFDAMSYGNVAEREAARIALRERLAQPEQEPAARLTCEELGYVPLSADGKSVYIDGVGLVRLEQPEQDVPEESCGNMGPVGWLESPNGVFRANPLYKIKFPSKLLSWQVSLYTAPPQRKPLTGEQRKDLMNKAWNKWLGGEDDNHLFAWHFSFEVEAAHGIKENT